MSVVTPSPPPPPDVPVADPIPLEPPLRPWWMAKRVLLGALGVVIVSAGATLVLALNEIDKVVEALGQSKAVQLAPKVLAPTSRGAPQTLLLVGDDRRPPPKSNPGGFVLPHSNEMLLVRIDPSKPTISMLSIPRELQVRIQPAGGQPVVDRINAAYTIGGIGLMTETIKRVLGISVNHVFVVTFPKFKRAVDEMGCLYLTVDRRYYHVNEPGGEQYFEINLQPGYQRLCGRGALEFVANRHEDTSLTRDARDQRFLLETKAQYGPTLFESRERFEHILGRAVETDMHGSSQVLDLLTLLVQAQGKPVRQIHFQVNLLPSYDTATPRQIRESVRTFLLGTAPVTHQRLSRPAHATRAHRRGKAPPQLLASTPGSTLAHARSVAPSLPFALEYPRARRPYGAAVPDTLRTYDIRDPHGRLHPIYTIVLDGGPLGEFYDVQGTSWTQPPLLSNPSQTVHVGSRTYELFYAGEQLRTMAWREGEAVYWIQNSLTNSVPPQEMLAIAEQTVPVVGTRAGAAPGNVSARAAGLPARASSTVSLSSELGAVAGLASLAALAMLAFGVLTRRRELSALREQVAHAMRLEARLRPLLATPSITPPVALSGADAAAYTRTDYRAHRRPRVAALAAGAAALVAILVLLAVRLALGGSSPSATPRLISITVFNATTTPDAAHTVAGTLQANHLHVAKIGDIKESSLAHGAYVMYPPGAEQQAQRIARLIPNLSPTVSAIPPQVQNAVGQRDAIVVLLN